MAEWFHKAIGREMAANNKDGERLEDEEDDVDLTVTYIYHPLWRIRRTAFLRAPTRTPH